MLPSSHTCSKIKTIPTPNPFRNLALWKRRQQYLYYNNQKQQQSNSQQVSQRVGLQGQSSSTTTSTSTTTTTLTLDRIIALEKIPGWTWRY